MKDHAGFNGSLRKGAVYSTSTQQKMNTKSSTEAKLVYVDDLMPMKMCTRYLLNAKGYEVGASKVYQDNQIVMFLDKNRRASSKKRIRHVSIR